MAFVAEDGTGLDNSNSYTTVEFADDYHADRGNTDWAAATTAEKQAALIRASDFIDKRFGRRFKGWKQTKQQAMEWPRLDALDNDDYLLNSPDDSIPRQLQKACAEYALRALATMTLAPDNSNVGLTSLKEKVGPIEASQTRQAYKTASGSSLVSAVSIPEYPEADLWIEELLKPHGMVKIVRG